MKVQTRSLKIMINKKNIKEHYKKRMLEIRDQEIVKDWKETGPG